MLLGDGVLLHGEEDGTTLRCKEREQMLEHGGSHRVSTSGVRLRCSGTLREPGKLS
jgi:hypothetical protein